jgi:poly(A) polymerase
MATDPEDLLRVACRVAVEGVVLPPAIAEAARGMADRVTSLSPAKVRAALGTIITAPYLGAGLQWLHDAGVLVHVLPELDATVNFSQEAGRRHKDVWEHTKQVVEQSTSDPIVRWSALLHDVGKVKTRRILPGNKVTFHRHAEVGARMFDRIARRFEFVEDERQNIRFLIHNHLRANAYEASWSDGAVRRFDREMGEHLQRLVELSLADVTSRRPGRKQEAANNVEALVKRIESLRELDARVPPLPPGLGNAIMTAFALPPSRRIGELRQLCEDAVERGDLEERREAEYYLGFLRTVIEKSGG